MKTLRFLIFLFYRYYSKGGTREIPYFSSLCAVALSIFLHFMQFVILFDAGHLVFINSTEPRIARYGKALLFLAPIVAILAVLVPRKDILNATYDDSEIRKGNVLLLAYVISNVLFFFICLIFFTRPR